MANAVLKDLSAYKVCAVCGAIVDRSSETCPDCLAYRFIEDENAVSDKALDLAVKPQTALSHLDLEE